MEQSTVQTLNGTTLPSPSVIISSTYQNSQKNSPQLKESSQVLTQELQIRNEQGPLNFSNEHNQSLIITEFDPLSQL